MTDNLKHKMFTDPITLITKSQLLMLLETAERAQKQLHKIMVSIAEKNLMTADLLEMFNALHTEQHWALLWIEDKTKNLGIETIEEKEKTILQ